MQQGFCFSSSRSQNRFKSSGSCLDEVCIAIKNDRLLSQRSPFSPENPQSWELRLLRSATMSLQRACFGDAQNIGGCSWWFLVRLRPGTWYNRLIVVLCGYVSSVIYEEISWSTCTHSTGSLDFLQFLHQIFFFHFWETGEGGGYVQSWLWCFLLNWLQKFMCACFCVFRAAVTKALGLQQQLCVHQAKLYFSSTSGLKSIVPRLAHL